MPAQALQALSAAERGRLAQFRQAADQWRLLLGRTLVRSTLQGEWGIAWAPLELSALGRPRLAPGHGGPPVDFNLSHAGEWVVCAFSDDAAVGIDIAARAEFRDWEQFASGYLHANERRAMAAAPAPGQAARAARYWTLKEAILKCAGFGLQVDPRELELQLEPRATLARAHPRLPPPERLILDERQLEGEPLALAVQPPGLAAGTALAIDIRQVPWDALVGRFQP
jgi:4'-phosphopantetheinyl transferase